MFTYEGTAVENGSLVQIYTVRFYDKNGVARYVTVDTELPADPTYGQYYDRIQNGQGNTTLWVALAEKAYAEANSDGFVIAPTSGSDSYSALGPAFPAEPALQAITGLPISGYAINPITIAANWYAGKLIVLLTNYGAADSHLVSDHFYAVVGFAPFNPANPFDPTYYSLGYGQFILMNPHGTNSSGWAPPPAAPNSEYGLFALPGYIITQNFQWEPVGGMVPGGKVDAQAAPFTPLGSAVGSVAGTVLAGPDTVALGRFQVAGETALANELFANLASQLHNAQARLEALSLSGNEAREPSLVDDVFALVAERHPFADSRPGA
jgi:hypothetical protein